MSSKAIALTSKRILAAVLLYMFPSQHSSSCSSRLWFFLSLLCCAQVSGIAHRFGWLLITILTAFALCHVVRRRMDFSKHLSQAQSALTTARYFRLMLMTIVLMVWTTIVSSINLAFSFRGGMQPYVSWSFVHAGFLGVGQFPTVFIPPAALSWSFALWWAVPVSSYIFTAFFAFGEDAMKEYKAVYHWIRIHIFRREREPKSKLGYVNHTFVVTFRPYFQPLIVLTGKAFRQLARRESGTLLHQFSPLRWTPSRSPPRP
jgi:hypothetical protein